MQHRDTQMQHQQRKMEQERNKLQEKIKTLIDQRDRLVINPVSSENCIQCIIYEIMITITNKNGLGTCCVKKNKRLAGIYVMDILVPHQVC
jgi:hypothetical protein